MPLEEFANLHFADCAHPAWLFASQVLHSFLGCRDVFDFGYGDFYPAVHLPAQPAAVSVDYRRFRQIYDLTDMISAYKVTVQLSH